MSFEHPKSQLHHAFPLVSVLNAKLLSRPVSPFSASKKGFLESVLVHGPALPLASVATLCRLEKELLS